MQITFLQHFSLFAVPSHVPVTQIHESKERGPQIINRLWVLYAAILNS